MHGCGLVLGGGGGGLAAGAAGHGPPVASSVPGPACSTSPEARPASRACVSCSSRTTAGSSVAVSRVWQVVEWASTLARRADFLLAAALALMGTLTLTFLNLQARAPHPGIVAGIRIEGG